MTGANNLRVNLDEFSCPEAAEFDHALRRTRRERPGGDSRVPCAASLSLGRSVASL